MNKFLELSLVNHMRNNEQLWKEYDNAFEPLVKEFGELLSTKQSDRLEEMLRDGMVDAFYYAGVLGMELAIGVTNGNIKQFIE